MVLLGICCRIPTACSFSIRSPASNQRILPQQTRRSAILYSQNNDSDDDIKENGNDNRDSEDPVVDAFLAEQEASRKVQERLLMPQRIGKALSQTVTTIGWSFLVASFLLQQFGYAFVSNGHGGFRIDTLETAQFQKEVVRSMKQDKINNASSK